MNRKIVNILLILYVLFTVYNTLIPFNFQPNGFSFETLIQSIEWRLFIYHGRRAPLTDIAGNVLLFLPFGFLAYLWRYQRRLHSPVFYAVLAGLLFSVFIEILQLFFGGRISSITDIFNNALGTFFGAVTGSIYCHILAEPIKRKGRELIREQPIIIILVVIFILQVLGAMIPFNVSITVSDLKTSIKHIIITPFHNKTLGLLLLDRPMGGDSQPFDLFKFIENFLFWSVWGYLTVLCYRCYWRIRTWGIWFAISVGFGPGILLEFAQIFIVSRYCNINDVISNWAGVLFGWLFHSINLTNSRFSSSDYQPQLKGAVWLYFAFIMFAGFQPFDFHYSGQSLNDPANLQRLVPFLAYFKKTSVWNISDLVSSLLYFFPIGLYFSYRLYQRNTPWRIIFMNMGIIGLLTGGSLEFLQIFSPSRQADITDALLWGAGGFLGTFSLFYYLKEIHPSMYDNLNEWES